MGSVVVAVKDIEKKRAEKKRPHRIPPQAEQRCRSLFIVEQLMQNARFHHFSHFGPNPT